MKIGISAGHGGTDPGGSANGYIEKAHTLDIAKSCRDYLNQNFQNVSVVMAREKDITISINDRAALFNNANVDVVIDIHTNAFSDTSVRGLEIIHSITGGKGEELAKFLFNYLPEKLGLPKRRVFSKKNNSGKDYYGIIRSTRMPAVIIEFDFHTNADARVILSDPKFKQKAGQVLAEALAAFYGLPKREIKEKEPVKKDKTEIGVSFLVLVIGFLLAIQSLMGIDIQWLIDKLMKLVPSLTW